LETTLNTDNDFNLFYNFGKREYYQMERFRTESSTSVTPSTTSGSSGTPSDQTIEIDKSQSSW